MIHQRNILNKIALLCIAMLVGIFLWGWLAPEIALSQQLESRLNSLESDLSRIESRLNSIEGRLNQSGRSTSPKTPSVQIPSPNNSGRKRPQLNQEQMFDRLATLVIELKDQINNLEARVSKLESRGTPSNTR